VAARDESPSRRRTDFEATGTPAKLRILAVDDDRSYLSYVRLVLLRAGFEVELADSGTAAIERLRHECDVDLLLIDYAMPDLDGIETVGRIHDECRAPALYTILLTARDEVETKLRALDSGLDDFLPKSASESEIVAKIRSAARRLEMERRLQTLAMTDELTGIANRRALFLAGEDILRSGRRLSVIMFDLDHFKAINDTLGHLAGDRILADVAASLRANTRYGDVIGRYGGDEFVLLLPDTEPEDARQISARVLANIRQLSVTAQVGIAVAAPGATLSDVIALCDQMLYRGKRRTRESQPDALL
jgi:diguanylate cyclase (GGDEF)-like protein